MTGLCECGCGQPTRIAPRTDAAKGWQKGKPLRFAAPGHNASVTNHPWRSITASDYTVEDRGFETDCWIWSHRLDPRSGHAMVMVGSRRIPAHCAAYVQFVGPIPRGHHLHHRCLQPSCVNPDHLRPLTPAAHNSEHARIRREAVAA